MARLLQFKNKRTIEEEASVWLSRMDRGLDREARAALESWVADDPRHAKGLIAMAALWDEMGVMRELSGLLDLSARPPPRSPPWRYGWLAGAIAVPAIVAGFLLLRPSGPAPMPPASNMSANAGSPTTPHDPGDRAVRAGAVYETRVGEQRTESLPDGSIVQLNTDSRIEVSFKPGERDITVHRGEAHFEVRHDAARPFLVTAAGRRIRAVGTAFNVRLESGGRLEVTVTEGQIIVSSDTPSGMAGDADSPPQEARVSAGEQLHADVADRHWRVERLEPETLSSRLAWQRGMLIFDGQPLQQALDEVSRYGDVRFEIRDAALRQMRVGGAYKPDDVEALVRSLEKNLDIVATREPDGRIVLSVPDAGKPR